MSQNSLPRILKGFRNKAQGCEPCELPWEHASKVFSTSKRLCSLLGFNPLRTQPDSGQAFTLKNVGVKHTDPFNKSSKWRLMACHPKLGTNPPRLRLKTTDGDHN